MSHKRTHHNLGLAFWLPVSWIAVVVLSAISAGLWPVPAFDNMDWAHLSAPPGAVEAEVVLQNSNDSVKTQQYLYRLGTDTMGRDVLSRLIHGARISLSVGLISPLIGFFFGGILGCLAGYRGQKVELLIVAAMDIILAFPGLVLLLAISFYLGPSLKNLILVLGFLTIPAFSRVARAKTLALRNQPFVEAARLGGAGHLAILTREVIPNMVAPLAVYGLLVAAFMIMAEGALSFLGLGVAPPTPSWGGMIAEGREVLEEAPHVSLIPAGVMFLTVLSLNLIGDSLRHYFEDNRRQI